jgi:hypothetical protein
MAGTWQEWATNNPSKMQANSAAAFEPGPVNPAPFSVGIHLQPQVDPLEWLPPAAQEKLRALRLRSAESHRLVPEFSQISEASTARVAAANALKRLVSHPQDFGAGLDPSDPRVITAQKHLDKMTADFTRLQELQAVRTAQWQSASGALANAETWLRDGRPHGVTLHDHETEPPKLAKGENGLLDAIETRRRRVRELRADLHRIQSAPYPSAYAKQQMRGIATGDAGYAIGFIADRARPARDHLAHDKASVGSAGRGATCTGVR